MFSESSEFSTAKINSSMLAQESGKRQEFAFPLTIKELFLSKILCRGKAIDGHAKDGGEEHCTTMHRI